MIKWKPLFYFVLILSLISPVWAAEPPRQVSDLELVRQYVTARQSPVRKAIYNVLVTIPFIETGLVTARVFDKNPLVKVGAYGYSLYVTAGLASDLFKILRLEDKRTVALDEDFGLPSDLEVAVTRTEMTPDELGRVRHYLRQNRRWSFRSASPFFAATGLLFTSSYLKKLSQKIPSQRGGAFFKASATIAGWTSLLMFMDAINYGLFGNLVSPTGQWLERTMGMPAEFENKENATRPSEVLNAIVRMSPEDAKAWMEQDSAVHVIVRQTADVIRSMH